MFVQHKGSDKSIWKGDRPGQRLMALKQAISLENASARPADISFVIDQLENWHGDAYSVPGPNSQEVMARLLQSEP